MSFFVSTFSHSINSCNSMCHLPELRSLHLITTMLILFNLRQGRNTFPCPIQIQKSLLKKQGCLIKLLLSHFPLMPIQLLIFFLHICKIELFLFFLSICQRSGPKRNIIHPKSCCVFNFGYLYQPIDKNDLYYLFSKN